PFSLAELVARVRAQLRASGTGEPEDLVLRVGPRELDVAHRSARVGEQLADLTDREFRLLHHLVRHSGVLISRQQLLEEVWGYHFDPCSNVGDVHHGAQERDGLPEVPLIAAMFLAMVWHARRRQQAMRAVEAIAETRARLLERQERFLHDVTHELRTPVTIARGHLELLGWDHPDSAELVVALDELARIERIINRLLLLAKVDRPDFLAESAIDVEPFVEDVFVRWSDVAPRVWRLGHVAHGTVEADAEALRAALDALLENAVKHTEPYETVELGARSSGHELVFEVADGGRGVPEES